MTITGRKARSTGAAYGLKSLIGEGPGVYEAIVSVFGNVDYAGDRVLFGAFTDSLAAWKASGDPIPVVFAHQWDDLDAHVGVVLEAEELAPGNARLPAELMANGGLWVKFRLDTEEDFAARLAKRLDRRSIREFSFAYDVITERRSSDGVNDLATLELIEVGPCLKGMNPATSLLAQTFDGLEPGHRSELGAKMVEDLRAMGEEETATALAKTFSHSFIAQDADPTRCVLCGLTRSTLGHLNLVSTDPDGTKAGGPGAVDPAGTKSAAVTYVGSAEELQDAVLEAAYAWASSGDVGAGGFYACHLEATFGDRVVFLVEGWNDPIGDGTPFEAGYTFADGAATLEEPHEVVVEATTRAKSRPKNRRSISGADGGATVPDEPKTGKAKGKAGDAEDPDTEDREAEPGGDPAVAELALAEAELAD